MKLYNLLIEDTSGHRRLVASIINMSRNMFGKSPTKSAVERYLKVMEKDTSFYDRILRKSKKLGGSKADRYYWGSIRKRCAAYFGGKK